MARTEIFVSEGQVYLLVGRINRQYSTRADIQPDGLGVRIERDRQSRLWPVINARLDEIRRSLWLMRKLRQEQARDNRRRGVVDRIAFDGHDLFLAGFESGWGLQIAWRAATDRNGIIIAGDGHGAGFVFLQLEFFRALLYAQTSGLRGRAFGWQRRRRSGYCHQFD